MTELLTSTRTAVPNQPTLDDAMKDAKGVLADARISVRRENVKSKALTERVNVARAGLATATAIIRATRATIKVEANSVTAIRAEAAEIAAKDVAARRRADADQDNIAVAELRARVAQEVLVANKDVTKVLVARVAKARHGVIVAERKADSSAARATVAELKEALARAKG
jgi:hypothetical protein